MATSFADVSLRFRNLRVDHLKGRTGEQAGRGFPDIARRRPRLDVEVNHLPLGVVQADGGTDDTGELEELVLVTLELGPGIGLTH
jgi:hypothetical protein